MDKDIEAWIRSACAQERIDAREVFWRVRDAASGPLLEAFDAAFATRIGSQAPTQLGLEVVSLPRPELQSKAAWVTASVADVRRQPTHASEQVTQALQGEVLEPLLHEEGWLLARLPDRYLGWVRDWHVQLVDAETPRAHAARADARIALPLARVRQAPRGDAAACAESVMGTAVVRRASRSGWTEIELPGGRCGWVEEGELRAHVDRWDGAAASVLATLKLFLGVPYLWGGKSPKGFDCSGLVQFVYGLHGTPLPRDSDQQFECGEPVSEFAAGDLLFFGTDRVSHVGVALDGRDFIHARGEVRHNSLDPGSSIHAPELAAILRGGRRVLPQRG